jgi:hypothetical protein
MKVRAWLWITVAVAAAAAHVGCSGGGSKKPLTVNDFCTMKAEAECQAATRCGTTATACQSQRQALCMQFAQATMSATRPFQPGNVSNCVNKTSSTYAKQTITPTDLAAMNDTCNYVFQGSQAKDGTCANKYECSGMVICDSNHLCETQVTRNNGDPCTGPGDVCNTGLYCTGTPVARCAPKKMLNDTCDDMTPCLETLRCVNGTCLGRAMPGESCTSDADCPTTGSSAAPYCDPYIGNKCDSGLSFGGGAPACVDYGGGGTGATGGSDGGGTGGAGGSAGQDGSSSGG